MLSLDLRHARPGGVSHVLCLGAHADDIEIGCGATLLSLLQSQPGLAVTWVVFSATGPRIAEARSSAEAYLAGAASKQVHVHDYRDGFFPHEGRTIKETFSSPLEWKYPFLGSE